MGGCRPGVRVGGGQRGLIQWHPEGQVPPSCLMTFPPNSAQTWHISLSWATSESQAYFQPRSRLPAMMWKEPSGMERRGAPDTRGDPKPRRRPTGGGARPTCALLQQLGRGVGRRLGRAVRGLLQRVCGKGRTPWRETLSHERSSDNPRPRPRARTACLAVRSFWPCRPAEATPSSEKSRGPASMGRPDSELRMYS